MDEAEKSKKSGTQMDLGAFLGVDMRLEPLGIFSLQRIAWCSVVYRDEYP